MGKRVHVVSKKEEYGKREAFNYKWDEFHKLLDALHCYTNGEYEDERFECVKSTFKRAITILKRYKENGVNADLSDLETYDCDFGESLSVYIDLEEINGYIDALGGDIDSIIDDMETYLKECDPDWDWIVFIAY